MNEQGASLNEDQANDTSKPKKEKKEKKLWSMSGRTKNKIKKKLYSFFGLTKKITELTWFSEDSFVINPVKKGNGVKPISRAFCQKLPEGWKGEDRFDVLDGKKPGPIDAVVETSFGRFAIEWETGNISSSHRALNKLAIGIIQSKLIGGILIVPTKKFYNYLTDRVGNYEELEAYFPLYKHLDIKDGILAIIAVEHDGTSEDAPIIGKGKDGNARKKAKRKKQS